jgi:nicotinamidase/pyrazinamidase
MTIGTLFWDVDTQHDFMDADGRLPAPDARSIVPNLKNLTDFAAEHGVPIVATADAHPAGDPEFEEFGRHCVPGTHGQKKIEETSPAGAEVADADRLDEQTRRLESSEIPQLVVEKQALDVFTSPLPDRILGRLEPSRTFVYGVATEYCVRAEVLSMLRRGWRVTVVLDAIKAIDEDAGREALREMREAGAETADTETVLRMVREEMEPR